MAILITGAGGFLGSALIPKLLDRGHKVYGLYRQKSQPGFTIQKLIPLFGDITQPDLGIDKVPGDIDAVIHCAALLSFSQRDRERIYQTNYQGTINLLEWMVRNKITRLFHLSTAYLFDHNDYEKSKRMAEEAIGNYPQVRATILRPGIIIGDSKLEGVPPLSGFYSGVAVIDQAKRWFEQKAGLPPLRTQIRIFGAPSATLNLVPVDVLIEHIISIMEKDKAGAFQLTHPDPPTLESLECPISEAIGADIKFIPEFKPNLLERVIAMSLKELLPYLKDCDLLPSDIYCPPLDSDFLMKSIKAFLKR
jgi:nucleoside-diphosphate-sugar epimerase